MTNSESSVVQSRTFSDGRLFAEILDDRELSTMTAATHSGNLHPLIALRLTHLASHPVGHRPNRLEPRAIKRHPNSYDSLAKPRAVARAELLTACSP